LQKFGSEWTHALAINDLYFDFMGPALASAGISGDGAPKAGSAGDGSEAAFQRIRGAQYQAITVAEPLNLQGWQLVDELNRNQFDPDSPYRAAYTAIWGK
jgi:ribose transport system substrate-binding protein